MMSELIVLDHLKKALSVPVSMTMRDDESYVLIERVGGTDGFIRTASFAIQSYGSSLYDACCLNERVKKAMSRLVESDEVSRVELDTDYNYTDEATKRYRYQAVFDLVLFGETEE
ncbi:hypothetical protein [uncultured Allobaculum sp.]|uniref:hypothetical protein n=1 Tax=uncultured Allobaculum sp. TaxID=1187017 RepID=UPI002582DAFD|nr:hypothetical protein [uncultured Allobaculum sp.]